MWSRLSRRVPLLLRGPLRSLCTASRLPSSPDQETISSVQLQDRDLKVVWSNNSTAVLPYIYLRDNCQEPESFDQSAKQRVFNPAFVVDLNIKATQADTSEGGEQLCITWPDGHRSRFSSSWLVEHSQGMAAETPRLPIEQKYWKSGYHSSMLTARFDFEKLMSDDGSLLEFLLQMDSCGLALVDNVGTESNKVKQFCDRIAYPKPCVYGRDVVKVEMNPDPSNLSYDSVDEPLHTSLPHYNYTPGVHVLHCIQQVPGSAGYARFCDGFSIASAVREKNPTAFQLLSQYPVQYVDVGKNYLDYHVEAWHLPISVSSSGAITAIHFNNHARGSEYPASLNDRLQEWYEAYYCFSSLTLSPEFLVEFKMEPGCMAVFDNLRVLHGRRCSKSEDAGHGCLEGAYLDWDEMRSRARVIMEKLGEKANK